MLKIKNAAKALKDMAYIFTCSYRTAWDQHLHPAITEEFTFEEVIDHIEGKGE